MDTNITKHSELSHEFGTHCVLKFVKFYSDFDLIGETIYPKNMSNYLLYVAMLLFIITLRWAREACEMLELKFT